MRSTFSKLHRILWPFGALLVLLISCGAPVTIIRKTEKRETVVPKDLVFNDMAKDLFTVGSFAGNSLKIMWVANYSEFYPSLGRDEGVDAFLPSLYMGVIDKIKNNKYFNISMNFYTDSMLVPASMFVRPLEKSQEIEDCHLYEVFHKIDGRKNYCPFPIVHSPTFKMAPELNLLPLPLLDLAEEIISSEQHWQTGYLEGTKLMIIFVSKDSNGLSSEQMVGKLSTSLQQYWKKHNVSLIAISKETLTSQVSSFCQFKTEIAEQMMPLLRELRTNDEPLSINTCDYQQQFFGASNRQVLQQHLDKIWQRILNFKARMILSQVPTNLDTIQIKMCGISRLISQTKMLFDSQRNEIYCPQGVNCLPEVANAADPCLGFMEVTYQAAERRVRVDNSGPQESDDGQQ